MRSEGLFCVHPSVRLSVCYHVFCHYAQQGGQKAIPMGSVPHWFDFKKGDFRKSTAFKSYGVKTKQTSHRRACAARVTVLVLSFCPSVRPSVCPSVTTFSATMRNKAAKKRYQRVQCHTGLILKRTIFVKVLRSKVMA